MMRSAIRSTLLVLLLPAAALAQDDRPVEALVADLGSEDWTARERATAALEARGPAAVGPLWDASVRAAELEVRTRALAILDRLDGSDPAILEALGRIGPPGLERVAGILARTDDTAAIAAGVGLLGSIEGPAAHELLAAYLFHPEVAVRARAARAIGRRDLAGDDRETLREMVDLDVGPARRAAAEALARHGDRWLAGRILVDVDFPSANDLLVEVAAGSDALALRAAVGLVRRGDRRGVPPLARLLVRALHQLLGG